MVDPAVVRLATGSVDREPFATGSPMVQLLESLVADYDGYEYAGEYDCLGGVVVESDASRLRVNNTFDSIVEDVWEEELREIADRLFEDEGQ